MSPAARSPLVPPPPSGLHGAQAHPLCSCCTSPHLGPEPGICEPGLLAGCACTGHLALRWWSGPQRTGFCVCVLAVITGSRPDITPQASLSFRPRGALVMLGGGSGHLMRHPHRAPALSSLLSPFPACVSLSYWHSLDEHKETSRTEKAQVMMYSTWLLKISDKRCVPQKNPEWLVVKPQRREQQ